MRQFFRTWDKQRGVLVRALPFVTSGFLAPKDLLHILAEPERYVDGPGLEPIVAFRVSPDGRREILLPNELDRFYLQAEGLGDIGSRDIRAIQCIPAGIYAWELPIKRLCEFLLELHNKRVVATHSHSRPGDFAWVDSPFVTPQERDTIEEQWISEPGIDRESSVADSRPTNPSIQRREVHGSECLRVIEALEQLDRRLSEMGEKLERQPLIAPYPVIYEVLRKFDVRLRNASDGRIKRCLHEAGFKGVPGVKEQSSVLAAIRRIIKELTG